MEDILASIRRIIADDQAFIQSGVAAPAPAAPPTYQAKEPPRFRTEPQPPSFAPPSSFAPPPNREIPPRAPYMPPPPAHEDYLAQARPAPAAPIAPPSSAAPVRYPIDGAFQSYKTAAYAPLPEPLPYEEPRDLQTRDLQTRDLQTRDLQARDLPPPPMAAAEPFAPRPEQRPPQRPADVPLVSPQTDAAVSSAFGALIASQKLPSDEEITGMVREMLRPMLKAWLDDNLPVLVERLVRMEIERVARGR